MTEEKKKKRSAKINSTPEAHSFIYLEQNKKQNQYFIIKVRYKTECYFYKIHVEESISLIGFRKFLSESEERKDSIIENMFFVNVKVKLQHFLRK